MPLLSKLKKELEGLNLSDRIQGLQQGGASPTPPSQNNIHSSQYNSNGSYPSQQPSYGDYSTNDQQLYPGPPGAQNYGSQQYNSAHQLYNGAQPPYGSQAAPIYSSSPGPVRQPHEQQHPLSPSHLSNGQYSQDPYATLTPYANANGQGTLNAATPQWNPPPSENQYHAEHPAVSDARHGQIYPSQPVYSSQQDLQKGSNVLSSHTMLAAAGGFVAGGAAGFFIKDRIDDRRAKRRHGRTPADFSDFMEYPNMVVELDCNICDQQISGPYAHCKKCDGGDYDVCRDCLAQGETCEGKGKHNLVKVYPKDGAKALAPAPAPARAATPIRLCIRCHRMFTFLRKRQEGYNSASVVIALPAAKSVTPTSVLLLRRMFISLQKPQDAPSPPPGLPPLTDPPVNNPRAKILTMQTRRKNSIVANREHYPKEQVITKGCADFHRDPPPQLSLPPTSKTNAQKHTTAGIR
ncbi:hypothetical protein OPT61_g3540 [Boeremia exigua]|uniref:Uncharacterized protein n=1 Tax=Boeremia exigua TaxID=749465 RepID=A0ACC2IHF7_9PLEO|nr:hypothetical protein OPT61_g3540 [Boeremia exigua]